MYPNQYCHQCTEPDQCVTVPPPPDCTGEPCEEIVLDTCVRYTGPNIPCLGIVTGANINQIVQLIANRLCDCCDGTPPVVNCVVSDWSAWSTCVNGVQTRTRTVIQQPQNGGTACPPLTETRECCTPVNCVVSAWGPWSECVGGQQTRTRTVVTPASCGGTACPSLTETQSCGTPPATCPPPEFTVVRDGCDAFDVTVTYNASQPTVTMEYQAVGATSWTAGGMLTTTLAGPNVISITGLASNTTYNVRVKTKCTPTDSDWVTNTVVLPACATCTPIENITLESSECETATVSFFDDGTATVLTGELFNAASPTVVVDTKIWTPTGTAFTYSHTFTSLTPGNYFVKITKNAGAINCDVVQSTQMNVAQCTSECPAPTNLDLSEVCDHTNNGIIATASAAGASVLTLEFELYHVTGGNILVDTKTASIPGGGSGSINFFNLGLIAGDTYEVKVITVCENFAASTQISQTIVKAACRPDAGECPPPTGLTATVS